MVVNRSHTDRPAVLVAATVAGPVTRTVQHDLVTLVRRAVARFGTVNVLIWLERYTGPHHDGRFDPDGVWNGRDADGIAKIAVVGEPAWKTIPPAAVGHRVPIEYFSTEQAARCWLASGPAHDIARRVHEARSIKSRIPR